MDVSENKGFGDLEDEVEDEVDLLSVKKKRRTDKNLDYVLCVVDEEVALLKDEIELQNCEIENVKERLDKIEKKIKK